MIGAQTSDSLANVNEIELVRHLISDWHWGAPVLRMISHPRPAVLLPEVSLSPLGAQGDIDVLSFSTSDPSEAIAVQVKLAKVSAKTYVNGTPNKLQEIRKLHQQSTLLVQLGFWKVYSCLIILVDSRFAHSGDGLYGGLSPELHATIEAAMSMEGLPPQAGFLQVQLVQPPDHAPLTTGEISCHMRRFATAQSQPARVTKFVSRQCAPNISFHATA